MSRPLLIPGRNCWRLGLADEAAVLIDAEAYFESLYVNLQKARRSIYILAWDVDSRQRLIQREPLPGEPPARLAEFLDHLAVRREGLEIHLLCWDYSALYAFAREKFQKVKLGWQTHPRVKFRYDSERALTASHHHKLVVVDDALAYVGGLDITGARWDTAEHEPGNPRRVLANGTAYAPFHDVQIAVTGEPAAWLGELCRERWERGTGEAASPLEPWASDFVLPGERFRSTTLGLARTVPGYKNVPEEREVERLFLDMIDRAERYLYIENQYFTANVVVERLKTSLSRPRGPEVVMVLPKQQDNWLSKLTMGSLSEVAVATLRKADREGRFHVYYPEDTRLKNGWYVNVHAKVMAADDRYLRVGSANLNNRSMGLDTECDAIVGAAENPDAERGIRRVVARLVGHHAGVPPDSIERAWERRGSLAAVVDDLCAGSPKKLCPFAGGVHDGMASAVAELEVIDPERPLGVDRLIDDIVFRGQGKSPRNARAKVSLELRQTLAVVFVFALLAAAGRVPSVPAEVFLALFVGFGLCGVPLTVFVAAATVLYRPVEAFGVACLGAAFVAVIGYGVGRVASSRLIHRATYYLMRQRLVREKVWAVMLIRIFPLSPYGMSSLAAGHAGVRAVPYLIGSALAGLCQVAVLTGLLRLTLRAVRGPGLWTVAEAMLAAAFLAGAVWALGKRFAPLKWEHA